MSVSDPYAPSIIQASHPVTPVPEARPINVAPEDIDPKPFAEVPEGSVKEILAWIDGDKKRAEAALASEKSKETPRRTLIAELNDLLKD